MAAVLVVTGHDPIHTYRRLFVAAFGSAALDGHGHAGDAAPLHRLAAAVAFRMQLFNIGAEGQLYIGAISSAGLAIWLGPAPLDGSHDRRDVRLRRRPARRSGR
jgi:simple sugar transport system permease protein